MGNYPILIRVECSDSVDNLLYPRKNGSRGPVSQSVEALFQMYASAFQIVSCRSGEVVLCNMASQLCHSALK
ncbi:uncharacterized protein PHALS_01724 [Plasmopara halstedii]|uniref:Uncharacterized protein n=1 Tax=Plasmopara halstedii TaxID=4781 RepID=A0A0P1AXF1_PLAHL|nr:uncharacterized protein PHALS_01724 [Plasmopara halstedii]CEG45428.1 hypothetical protein PHALS_01724 [Plasmopara halstedii]|eukprot:XP_024581797.1 hypothetical protein PHALS_01724 [Plasmopara halstedii]